MQEQIEQKTSSDGRQHDIQTKPSKVHVLTFFFVSKAETVLYVSDKDDCLGP